jgi:Bacterial PH domain
LILGAADKALHPTGSTRPFGRVASKSDSRGGRVSTNVGNPFSNWWSVNMLEEIVHGVFELGKVLIKVELSKGESAKLIRTLGRDEKETILLQKQGKYWNQQNRFDRPDGLVVVTNHRLVFLSKVKTILTKTDFLSFPVELIKDLETTRVMLVSPAIRFKFEDKVYMFTFFSNATEVRERLESAMKIRA